MASVAFPDLAKKVTLSDGTVYGYVHVPPKDNKPTVLLVHGFPSSSYDWRHQIKHLPIAGYGVLVPDLLGYGDTDKPADPERYRLHHISRHVNELLDKEGLEKIVAVAHDWGSGLLSRFWLHYKHRVLAMVFVDVGYFDPCPLDLDQLQAISTQAQGFPTVGYMRTMVSPQGPKLLEKHSEAFDRLIYTANPDNWVKHFGPDGALEAFLESGETVPDAPVASEAELEIHNKILASGGYTGPLNWYIAPYRYDLTDQEKSLTAEDRKITVPTLLITTEREYAIVPGGSLKATAEAADDFKTVKLPTSHWVMLEDREGLQRELEEFLSGLSL